MHTQTLYDIITYNYMPTLSNGVNEVINNKAQKRHGDPENEKEQPVDDVGKNLL